MMEFLCNELESEQVVPSIQHGGTVRIHAPCGLRMLTNGNSWGSYKSGISATREDDDFPGNTRQTETPLFSLYFGGGQSILVGFMPGDKPSSVRCENGVIEGRGSTDCWIGIGKADELALRYAEFLPQMPTHQRNKPVIGWNSWDYYFKTVTEEAVAENIQAIMASPVLREKVRYIIIDDGWQRIHGDWTPSSKFHGDLSRVVKQIRGAGLVPGIWTAPFLVEYFSALARWHFDWLGRNEKGEPDFDAKDEWRAVLDPTHPEAAQFIHEMFTNLRKQGFGYFKIDFVSRLLKVKRFHDGSTPLAAVRRGMEIIRRAVGEKAVIAGCGMPLESGYGLVDTQRVSGDISTYWSTIRTTARDWANSWWLHRKQWLNDPDFLIVRNPATTGEKNYNPYFPATPFEAFSSRSGPPTVSLSEAEVWASIVLLSGGPVILGDRIGGLNASGRRMIETVLEHVSVNTAKPLDWGESSLPRQWLRDDGDSRLFAIFNWEDAPAMIKPAPPCPSGPGLNIWSGAEVELNRGMELELPPRSVLLVKIRK